METITIKIKGMTCGGCVSSVTSVLQKIAGVSSVDVSLEENQATINFEPTRAQRAQFESAIEDAGFDVA